MAKKKFDKKAREDFYHQTFKRLLESIGLIEGKDFLQFVTSNPDFIFLNNSCLGEVKRDDMMSNYKSAFIEIKNREGKEYDIKYYDNFFILTDKYLSFYKTSDIDWSKEEFTSEDFEKYIVRFNNKNLDIKTVWVYIENNCKKIYVESDISNVLDMCILERV